MFILRLIHGLFRILGVFLAYTIAQRIAGTRTAENVGVMMASLAWLPLLSVHQLAEVFVIPLLLAFAWFVINGGKYRHLLLSGLFLGLATGFRYQVGVMGLGLLLHTFIISSYRGSEKKLLCWYLSSCLTFALVQLPADLILWGEPFAQLRAYIVYNLNNSTSILKGHMLSYLALFIIADSSSPLLLYTGISNLGRSTLYCSSFSSFYCFHSLFPNKQERFILPAIPFIIIAGLAYWQNIDRNKLLVRATVLSTSLSILQFFSANSCD